MWIQTKKSQAQQKKESVKVKIFTKKKKKAKALLTVTFRPRYTDLTNNKDANPCLGHEISL